MNGYLLGALIGYSTINAIVLVWFLWPRIVKSAMWVHRVLRRLGRPRPKNTTKVCPHCGDTQMVCFTSMNKKWCSGCHQWLTWNLEPGQKPLF